MCYIPPTYSCRAALALPITPHREREIPSGRSASTGRVGTAPRRPHTNGRAARGHVALGSRVLSRPADPVDMALSLIAGNRARTLGARFYTGGPCLETVPTPPARRAFDGFLLDGLPR
ncbi:MAG TPA: hypothetical protein VF550_15610 [Polyangia bacterium]